MNDKKHINLLFRMLALLVVLAVDSCSGEDNYIAPLPEEADDGMYVDITLSCQGSGETRSGEDDSGSIFGNYEENYINIDDLYIMTFDIPDGKTTLDDESKLIEILWAPTESAGRKTTSYVSFIGEDIVLQSKLSPKINDKDYYFDGATGKYKDFCVVVLANVKTFKPSGNQVSPVAGMEFKDLLASTHRLYSKSASSGKWSWKPASTGTTGGMPMFGVRKVSLKGYDPEFHSEYYPFTLTSDDEPLWLLRSLSKVEISLSEELLKEPVKQSMGNITIASATVGSNYASDFWVIPELSRMNKFTDTGNTSFIDKVPGSGYIGAKESDKPTPTTLSFLLENDNKRAVVYLPEYPLTASDPEVTISLNIGTSIQTFKFVIGRKGTLTATGDGDTAIPKYWTYLLRNHYYKFIVDVDFKIISVTSDNWGQSFDNYYDFGDLTSGEEETESPAS